MGLKEFFVRAQKEKWAIGQFNFSTLEQLRGILEAAQEEKSPVIVGTSQGESKFLDLRETVALVEISKLKYHIPIFLNLDHGKDQEWIIRAIDFGYSAVHFDGSELSFDDNIRQTKVVAAYAHKKGIFVEGELGLIRGESKLHTEVLDTTDQDQTDPEQAKEFVEKTKINSLAISIGNLHGVYIKNNEKLNFERLQKISENTDAFLVLHGGSGIQGREIKTAIELGISKINVNTELRLVWRESLEKILKEDTSEAKPYKILTGVQKEIQKKVGEKITLFGSTNKAA